MCIHIIFDFILLGQLSSCSVMRDPASSESVASFIVSFDLHSISFPSVWWNFFRKKKSISYLGNKVSYQFMIAPPLRSCRVAPIRFAPRSRCVYHHIIPSIPFFDPNTQRLQVPLPVDVRREEYFTMLHT